LRLDEKIAQGFSSHSRPICDQTRERGTASLPTAEINTWAIAERKERSIKISARNENRADEAGEKDREAVTIAAMTRTKEIKQVEITSRIRDRAIDIVSVWATFSHESTVFILVFVP